MDPILLVIISIAFMLAMWANRDQNYGGVSQPSYKRCVSRVTGCMRVQIPPPLLRRRNGNITMIIVIYTMRQLYAS